jgi:hypothetical protein
MIVATERFTSRENIEHLLPETRLDPSFTSGSSRRALPNQSPDPKKSPDGPKPDKIETRVPFCLF